MIDFLTGPMLWISLVVCFGGLLARVVWYIRGLDWKLDRVAYRPHMSIGLRGALRSVLCWITPMGTHSWRQQPFMAAGFFLFHIGAVLVPLFLMGHNIILEERFGFSLPTLPWWLADGLTVAALAGAAMLALRRIALTEVRILTSAYDWFILAVSAAPFLTGFIARLHVGDYQFWLVMHIITGELLLVLIPFTKLSHVALFFMSRGQLGMDYNIKRGGMKRTAGFPW
ncbi:HmcE, 25.3 kd protein in hmc operon [Oleidesulfovibrio alaskensis G20]|jgi:nitrate reductase gamma subunit|uniref:HmcE, 25.3 kd protein in hmc operon n=1 Tax=Oleidesulfovibrio alaskensis (strain ATCC BAA-1058 / DSM 17464 / G20) TaxID=207559 RepID=Q315E6_OLEA2|nr:hypothetical protein [Oleidesulfovibrio alaskensis]ABB37450.1 HmcE, 25.3 kd protein in hmc operon [Oleidesulfovibrio alaskensis G20]MBG0774485.1 hypothetical protein [Oleidesulfovibrio alaskensis]MBL3580962.1 hypothetical protein [Oleidesulfovibrio alaskensis]